MKHHYGYCFFKCIFISGIINKLFLIMSIGICMNIKCRKGWLCLGCFIWTFRCHIWFSLDITNNWSWIKTIDLVEDDEFKNMLKKMIGVIQGMKYLILVGIVIFSVY